MQNEADILWQDEDVIFTGESILYYGLRGVDPPVRTVHPVNIFDSVQHGWEIQLDPPHAFYVWTG